MASEDVGRFDGAWMGLRRISQMHGRRGMGQDFCRLVEICESSLFDVGLGVSLLDEASLIMVTTKRSRASPILV